MAEAPADRVIRSLEAAFDAAEARAASEAASDLALSLVQDRSLAQALQRLAAAEVVTGSGTTLPVSVVGADFLIAGSRARVLIPLECAVVVNRPTGPAPTTTELTLLQILRTLSRRGTRLEVVGDDIAYAGRLVAAGRDHIVLDTSRGRVFIASARLQFVRLLSEDLKDVP